MGGLRTTGDSKQKPYSPFPADTWDSAYLLVKAKSKYFRIYSMKAYRHSTGIAGRLAVSKNPSDGSGEKKISCPYFDSNPGTYLIVSIL